MKKKTKIILCSVVGTLALAGIGTGIGLAIDNSNNKISGTLVESGDEYGWVKHDVWLCPEQWHYNKYYTNCGDDCIEAIHLITLQNGHQIDYDTDFNLFDDFDACFVISKFDGSETITSDVERTHSPVGGDDVFIYYENAYRSSWYIKEIWVRTVD